MTNQGSCPDERSKECWKTCRHGFPPYLRYICYAHFEGWQADLSDDRFWKLGEKGQGVFEYPTSDIVRNRIRISCNNHIVLVPAHFLETIILDSECNRRFQKRGIRISNAFIYDKDKHEGGKLSLSSGKTDFAVRLEKSHFAVLTDLSNFQVGGVLSFSGSTFHHDLDAKGLIANSHLILRNIKTDSEIIIRSARVKGHLLLNGACISNKLDLDNISIGGYLSSSIRPDCNISTFKGIVTITNAVIERHINFSESIFTEGLNMSFSHIKENLTLNGTSVEKSLGMDSVLVEGDLEMTSQEKVRASYTNVSMRNAEIKGHAKLYGCNISGDSLKMNSIQAAALQFRANKHGHTKLPPSVDLRFARIGLVLEFGGISIEEFNGVTSAKLDSLPFQPITLANNCAKCGYDTKNNLLTFQGVMTSKVRGTLLCLYKGDTKYTQAVENIFQRSQRYVDLTGALIGDELRLIWVNEDENGGFKKKYNNWGSSKLVLKNVRCHSLQDCDEGAWPSLVNSSLGEYNIDLAGFSYNVLRGPEKGKGLAISERKAGWVLNWLDSSKSYEESSGAADSELSTQPYIQMAKVLTNCGRNFLADEVIVRLNDRKLWQYLGRSDSHQAIPANSSRSPKPLPSNTWYQRYKNIASFTYLFLFRLTTLYGTSIRGIFWILAILGLAGFYFALDNNPNWTGENIVYLDYVPRMEISSSMSSRLSIDDKAHLLKYAGVMSNEEKEWLNGRSDDAKYRDAINTLFYRSHAINNHAHNVWSESFLYSAHKLVPGFSIFTKEEVSSVIPNLHTGAKLYFALHQFAGWVLVILLGAGLAGWTRKIN